MPIDVTWSYQLYSFEELLELKREKKIAAGVVDTARQWLCDAITDGEWWDYTEELWTSALNQIGFTDPKIEFSGFSSQGDGASFTANVDVELMIEFLADEGRPVDAILPIPDSGQEDFANWVRHHCPTGHPEFRPLLDVVDDIRLKVVRISRGYSHYNTCDVEMEYSGPDQFEELAEKFQKYVEDLRESLSKIIYSDLEDEYWALQEEESIQEFASGNNYTFTINGEFEQE